jgi:hypothetical protein
MSLGIWHFGIPVSNDTPDLASTWRRANLSWGELRHCAPNWVFYQIFPGRHDVDHAPCCTSIATKRRYTGSVGATGWFDLMAANLDRSPHVGSSCLGRPKARLALGVCISKSSTSSSLAPIKGQKRTKRSGYVITAVNCHWVKPRRRLGSSVDKVWLEPRVACIWLRHTGARPCVLARIAQREKREKRD